MTITYEHLFYLGIAWVIVGAYLEIRSQKIAKTLASNLVTLFVRGEDNTEKMVELFSRQAFIRECITDVQRKAQDQTTFLEHIQKDFDELRKQIRILTDSDRQIKIVIDSLIEDKLADLEESILNKVRSDLANQVAAIVKENGGSSPSFDQVLEVLKNSGAIMDKFGPIADILDKVRNGVIKTGHN